MLLLVKMFMLLEFWDILVAFACLWQIEFLNPVELQENMHTLLLQLFQITAGPVTLTVAFYNSE